MSNQEREEYMRQLTALQFDEGQAYTRDELSKMDDGELIACYNTETAPEAESETELETCCVCEQVKVCPFATDDSDPDGAGRPVCAICGNEAIEEESMEAKTIDLVEDDDDEDEEEEDDDDDEEDDDELDDEGDD